MRHPHYFPSTYSYINMESKADLPIHSPMTAGAYSSTYTPRPDGGSVTESDPDNPILLGLIWTSRVIGASNGLFKPISNKALFYKRISVMWPSDFQKKKKKKKKNTPNYTKKLTDVPDMRISWPGFLAVLEAQRSHSVNTTPDTVIPPLFHQSPAVHLRHYQLLYNKSKKCLMGN